MVSMQVAIQYKLKYLWDLANEKNIHCTNDYGRLWSTLVKFWKTRSLDGARAWRISFDQLLLELAWAHEQRWGNRSEGVFSNHTKNVRSECVRYELSEQLKIQVQKRQYDTSSKTTFQIEDFVFSLSWLGISESPILIR